MQSSPVFSLLRHLLRHLESSNALAIAVAIGCTLALVPTSIATAEGSSERSTSRSTEAEAGSMIASGKMDALTNPEAANATAPNSFRVRFETTQGPIVIEAHRDWAPIGVDRFYNLLRIGFYEDIGFFRVIPNHAAEFGIHGDPEVTSAWRLAELEDDPTQQLNTRGTLAFSAAGPNSRTTQLVFNLDDNKRFDKRGYVPFARVVEGAEVLDKLNSTGEGRPYGPGPKRRRLLNVGNRYLKDMFPKLDYVESAKILD